MSNVKIDPLWLQEHRRDALKAFLATSLPTDDEEDWRYSGIDSLDLARFGKVERTESSADSSNDVGAVAQKLCEAIGRSSGVARVVDGFVVHVDLDQSLAAGGVVFAGASDIGGDEAPAGFGGLVGIRPDAFTHLADATGGEPLILDIPAGMQIEYPIVVMHELTGEKASATIDGSPTEDVSGLVPTSFPRLSVRLGQGAKATVVEVFVSGPQSRLVIPVVELDLAPASQLAYQSVQLLGHSTGQLGYQFSKVARDARLVSLSVALGGGSARLSTHSALVGAGAESQLLALYLGDGEQVKDLRTYQDHDAPHTKSELVFKGAVAGDARSVYTGLIKMRKGAVRSNASQTNRNLVLSEGAHADSVPNLDIEENDVRCSHASAVGPIDADQRFYVESRGVPPKAAERLIILGFFQDLLDRAPVPGLTGPLREALVARLVKAQS